jgi:hypothetical protein
MAILPIQLHACDSEYPEYSRKQILAQQWISHLMPTVSLHAQGRWDSLCIYSPHARSFIWQHTSLTRPYVSDDSGLQELRKAVDAIEGGALHQLMFPVPTADQMQPLESLPDQEPRILPRLWKRSQIMPISLVSDRMNCGVL